MSTCLSVHRSVSVCPYVCFCMSIGFCLSVGLCLLGSFCRSFVQALVPSRARTGKDFPRVTVTIAFWVCPQLENIHLNENNK